MNYVDINLVGSKFPRENVGSVFGGQIRLYQLDPAEMVEEMVEKRKRKDRVKPGVVSRVFRKISMVLFGAGLMSFSAVLFPQVSEFVDEQLSAKYVQVFTKPTKTFGDQLMASGDKIPEPPYQPVKDESLDRESRLVIEKIGVDAKIHESTVEEVEEALRSGVWRVKEFGTPYARKKPTILASHRFGFLEWTNQYRRANSFYNLPKLEKGDTVEINWAQRTYVYEVYQIEEGTEILDYQADLILYTCKFLDADTRIFVYARLLEI